MFSCILSYFNLRCEFTAYFGATSVPVTIPSSGIQRNSIGSFSQSPTSPLGGSLSSAFMSNPQQQGNKEDKNIEQVRNVSFHAFCIYYKCNCLLTKVFSTPLHSGLLCIAFCLSVTIPNFRMNLYLRKYNSSTKLCIMTIAICNSSMKSNRSHQ